MPEQQINVILPLFPASSRILRFHLVKSATAGGAAIGGHKLKALQIRKAALAVNNVFEDFVGLDWLYFKITVNCNG